MKCYHCEHYNIKNGICDFDNCEILNPWENIDCEYLYEEKIKTLFYRITASPEELAEKLVYQRNCKTIHQNDKCTIEYWTYSWKSTVIQGQSFENKAEAIAATVEKLNQPVTE